MERTIEELNLRLLADRFDNESQKQIISTIIGDINNKIKSVQSEFQSDNDKEIIDYVHYCPRKSVNILANLHILKSLTTV